MPDVRQPDDVTREDEAHAQLRAKTKTELREMVDALGLDVPAAATKDQLLEALGVPPE